jgi:hypothetical protein
MAACWLERQRNTPRRLVSFRDNYLAIEFIPKARKFFWRQHTFASALRAAFAQPSRRIEFGVAFLDSPIGYLLKRATTRLLCIGPALQNFVTDGTHILALDLCKDARAQCQLLLDTAQRPRSAHQSAKRGPVASSLDAQQLGGRAA